KDPAAERAIGHEHVGAETPSLRAFAGGESVDRDRRFPLHRGSVSPASRRRSSLSREHLLGFATFLANACKSLRMDLPAYVRFVAAGPQQSRPCALSLLVFEPPLLRPLSLSAFLLATPRD